MTLHCGQLISDILTLVYLTYIFLPMKKMNDFSFPPLIKNCSFASSAIMKTLSRVQKPHEVNQSLDYLLIAEWHWWFSAWNLLEKSAEHLPHLSAVGRWPSRWWKSLEELWKVRWHLKQLRLWRWTTASCNWVTSKFLPTNSQETTLQLIPSFSLYLWRCLRLLFVGFLPLQ